MLSWEAATERLLDAAALPAGTRRPRERPLHTLAYYTHYAMGANAAIADGFRVVTGAPSLATWNEARAREGPVAKLATRTPRPRRNSDDDPDDSERRP